MGCSYVLKSIFAVNKKSKHVMKYLASYHRVLFLSPKDENGVRKRLVYQDRGGWLLTSPEEDFNRMGMMPPGDAANYQRNEAKPTLMMNQTGIQVGVVS